MSTRYTFRVSYDCSLHIKRQLNFHFKRVNMHKRTTFKRVICFILMLISLYSFSLHQCITAVALGVYSDELERNTISQGENNSEDSEIDIAGLYSSDGTMYEKLDYSPLLSEEKDLRSQFEKHFQRKDRAYEAVMYPYPVHYNDNGTWADIDNTLITDKDSKGNTVYRTAANEFRATFSDSYTESGDLVSISRENYSVGFNFIGLGQESKAVVKNNSYDAPKSSAEKDMQMRFPARLTSEISYEDISDNISLTYKVTPTGITELINLKSPTNSNSFTTMLRVSSKLSPVINNDGSIDFFEGGTLVFKLDAPYMYDSSNEVSTNIEVELERKSDQSARDITLYIYKIIPDNEWLTSVDRVYPVVIDPTVTTPLASSSIIDTSVSSGLPNQINQNVHPGTLKLGYGSSSGNNRIYIKFNQLPTLSSGDMVINSALYMGRINSNSSSGDRLNLYQVNSSWSSSTLTWSNQPTNDSTVKSMAFAATAGNYNTWEITDLMKKWYAGTSNFGVMIKCATESTSNGYYEYYSSDNNYYTEAFPFASVVYVNSTGIEDIWSYHTQSVGEAGTGYVNDYNGNLTFIHSDAVTTGGFLPVAINHVYNSNDRLTDNGYGAGWRINYGQTLLEEEIGGKTYYKHIDGDGTAHYYYENSSNEWVNELDKDTKLDMSNSTYISIVDKNDNRLVFNRSTGNLRYIRDNNYSSSLKQISITYTKVDDHYVINKITDGTGLAVNFTYSDDNYLTKITCPDGTGVEFVYNSYSTYKNLNSIYYLGTDGARTGEVSEYLYSYRYLISATNYSGYKISYNYDLSGNTGYRRVNKITEYTGETQWKNVSISYGWNTTTFVDNNNRDEIYQFNNLGEPVCIRNADDSAQYCAFNGVGRTRTQIAAVSKLQKTTINLLANQSFEAVGLGTTLSSWYKSGTLTFPRSSTYKHSGSYSMNVNKSSTTDAGFILQDVGTLTSGEYYTFSGYFYGGSGAQLIIGYYDSDGTWYQQTVSEIITPESGEWSRYYVTFKAVSGASYRAGLFIPTSSTVTNMYADSFMLENAEALNRYNMLVNSDLSDLSGWSTFGTCTATTASSGYHPSQLSSNVVKLTGSGTGKCYVYQTIAQAGAKGDCYTFGGWMRSKTIPSFTYNNVDYGIRRIRVQFKCSGTWTDGGSASFNADTANWQYTCGAAVATAAYTEIRIFVEYNYNLNTAYIDGIQLFKDEFAQSYSYDSDGNITKVNTLAVQEDTFTYDANDNLTKYKDSNGNETNYTYDGKHNLTKATTPTGLANSFKYDDNGLVTESATYKNGTTSGYFLASKIVYNSNGMTSSVTDARGNSTSYIYKNNSRLLSTQTNPNGTKARYSYDTRNRLTSVAISNGSTDYGTVSYTYDIYNRRTGITHNGFDYVYTYDGFGNVITTKVKSSSGTITLATNAYDNSRGTLTSTTLGNGTVISYTYDTYDRIKNVKVNSTVKYEYTYDNEGNVSVIKDNVNNLTTQYYYDTAGRTARVYSSDGSAASYSYAKPGTSTLDVNLRRIGYTYNGNTWGTRYTYDADNRLTTVKLNNNYTVNYTYSTNTGLLTSRIYKNAASTPESILSEEFIHLNGSSSEFPSSLGYGDTVKSTLVSKLQSSAAGTFNYTYDASGNITSITNSTTGESYSYTYDDQNQLVSETLNFGDFDANTRTVNYTYDNYGNITKKVTRETISSSKLVLVKTKDYTYNNSIWKDLLTSYGSATITYDNSGNPTSYLGDTLTWTGNQLTQQVHGQSTISYSYNESGLRTKKSISGGTETTYVWKDGILCAMKIGTTVLEFSYSATGDVVSVLYRPSSGSSVRYYYARNAQGDIIGLVNSSGTLVVRYAYDSWGKAVAQTDSTSSGIGTLNPFRLLWYNR